MGSRKTPNADNYLLSGCRSLYFSSNNLKASLSTGFKYSVLLTGYFAKSPEGRTGRFSNPPPQFGQTLNNTLLTQSAQKVHSNVQIIAPVLSLGSAFPQFSQMGLISSILYAAGWLMMNRKINRICYKTQFVCPVMNFVGFVNHPSISHDNCRM